MSFIPVLTLEAQEGRLFKPLAFTKNFSMIVAAVLATTLDPAMRLLFTHMRNFNFQPRWFRPRWLARVANAVLVGKIHSEEEHPISRPWLDECVDHADQDSTIVCAAVATVAAPGLWRWVEGPPAGYCPICLRHEHKESMVKFQAEGERVTQACCLSCALTYGRQARKKVTILSLPPDEISRGAAFDPSDHGQTSTATPPPMCVAPVLRSCASRTCTSTS